MKNIYTKEIKLPKEELEIDPKKTWELIDEINDVNRNEILYEHDDIN